MGAPTSLPRAQFQRLTGKQVDGWIAVLSDRICLLLWLQRAIERGEVDGKKILEVLRACRAV